MSSSTVTVDPLALKAVATATFALFGKFVVFTFSEAFVRGKVGLRAPEDGKNFKMAEQTFKVDEKAAKPKDIELFHRYERIRQNDLDNIPLGLVIQWGCLLIPGIDPTYHAIAAALFAGGRFLHTIAYRYGSSLRGIGFMASFGSTIFMSVMGLRALYM